MLTVTIVNDYNFIVIETQSQLDSAAETLHVSPRGCNPIGVRAAMGRVDIKGCVAAVAVWGLSIFGSGVGASDGAQVAGTVRMPEICSPTVSPAVVYLTPAGNDAKSISRNPALDAAERLDQSRLADVVLVNQRGLQFLPRVQAIARGQSVRFANQDSETHNVHVFGPGMNFNQSMAPGQFRDFAPADAGVMRLACDVHHHMRGFVVVSPTRWVQVCNRDGKFRLDGVPDGHYVLTVWHEMGEPLERKIEVAAGNSLELPELVLSGPAVLSSTAGAGPAGEPLAPVRPWSEVLDRISMSLAASREAATRTGELARARRFAEDAYWGEFEASDLETAVKKFLGYSRSGALEQQFRAIRSAVRDVSLKQTDPSELVDLCYRLMLDLVAVTRELDAKGVTDRSRIDLVAGHADSIVPSSTDNPQALFQALKRGLRGVELVAEKDGPDEAASELTTVYMTQFEPLERYLMGRSPQDVRPLEIEFNNLRGDLASGLNGAKLGSRLETISSRVETLITRLGTQPAGQFGPAFFASLVTILREGIEVILILTMLLVLVGKATSVPGADSVPGDRADDSYGTVGGIAAKRTKSRAVRAIWWGVAFAAAASLATALALNVLVVSAQGAAREVLEGVVMLAAAGVLFYVSFWLISHTEAKRWMDFLKRQARRGLELGGQGTLGLTAFLAVYREGAETSLMYQALLGSEGRTRAGFLGLAAGVALGLVLLGGVAAILRVSTVRLPMQKFFKLSGVFLFGLAIVFAGNGVFELQNAGVLLITNLSWMGQGLPWAGLYPNLQVVSVQALLLAGAVLAWAVMPRASLGRSLADSPSVTLAPKRG
jgi:high-affinity iron transporter